MELALMEVEHGEVKRKRNGKGKGEGEEVDAGGQEAVPEVMPPPSISWKKASKMILEVGQFNFI